MQIFTAYKLQIFKIIVNIPLHTFLQPVYKLKFMKRKYLKLMYNCCYVIGLSTIASLLGCTRSAEVVPDPTQTQTGSWKVAAPALTVNQLDQHIKEKMEETQTSFQWNTAPTQVVWSAIAHSDYVLSVGYKPEQLTTEEVSRQISEIDIHSAAWETARQEVLATILAEEQQLNPTLQQEDILKFKEFGLPFLGVVVRNPSTIARLQRSPLVRYAEPLGYEPSFIKQAAANNSRNTTPTARSASSLGCSDGYTGNPNLRLGIDYTEIAPKALVSWNYSYHNIPQAWTASGSVNGSGIGVAIFDTGLGVDQPNLNAVGFNSGVQGRILVAKNALMNGNKQIITPELQNYNDPCGHGTSLAGVIAAPRRDVGSMVGVAYGSNLYAYRVTNDVYLDSSEEVYGVASAYYDAGLIPDVKIISMSLGRVGASGAITDAITFAYARGKMLFCASGTIQWISWLSNWFSDLNNLVFPANLNHPVYGKDIVLGISGITTSFNRCDDCVIGSATDFVAVMQRSNDGSNLSALGMPRNGDIPTTIGGSSVATATMAGMAALVWSQNPAGSRAEVLAKLQQASTYYPGRNKSFGWGIVNAATATQTPL